jgi:acylphosphatase
MPCLHLFISGRVQGVWFRESMKREAERLGVTGWVRNLDDGRVEAIVCGDQDKIDSVHAWAKKGPPLAQVAQIEMTPAEGVFAVFEKH